MRSLMKLKQYSLN